MGISSRPVFSWMALMNSAAWVLKNWLVANVFAGFLADKMHTLGHQLDDLLMRLLLVWLDRCRSSR